MRNERKTHFLNQVVTHFPNNWPKFIRFLLHECFIISVKSFSLINNNYQMNKTWLMIIFGLLSQILFNFPSQIIYSMGK